MTETLNMPKALQKGGREKDAVSEGGDGRRGNQWPQEWHTYTTGCRQGSQLGQKNIALPMETSFWLS